MYYCQICGTPTLHEERFCRQCQPLIDALEVFLNEWETYLVPESRRAFYGAPCRFEHETGDKTTMMRIAHRGIASPPNIFLSDFDDLDDEDDEDE